MNRRGQLAENRALASLLSEQRSSIDLRNTFSLTSAFLAVKIGVQS